MKWILTLTVILFALTSCTTPLPASAPIPSITLLPSVTPPSIPDLSAYAFPVSIDPSKQYLFYLHGKITEDQGLYAVSPDYGEYEYQAILERLASYGFVVISEQRSKNADGMKSAEKIAGQVTALLKVGVAEKNITVVGASKGGAITLFTSALLKNDEVNFVVLGNCHPGNTVPMQQYDMPLHGNVLTIRDAVDDYSGSCQDLFSFSEGKGLGRHNEIVLHIGTGHGIVYKPLDEWIIPTVDWAKGNSIEE